MLAKRWNTVQATLLFRLLKESLPKYWHLYAVAIAAMVVVSTTTGLTAWIMRDVVDQMIVEQNIERVLSIALAIAAIFLAKGTATYFQGYFLSRAGNGIVAEQQRKIYDRLLQQGLSYFQAHQSSDLIMRVTHNAQAARAVIDTIVTSFVRDLLTLIGLVIVMFIQQPILSAIALVGGPFVLLGLRTLLKHVREIMQQELMSLAAIIQVMQETTIGTRVLKAFSLEDHMQGRMNAAISSVERRANSIARIESLTSPMMETLSGLVIAGVVAASGFLVVEFNHTPGELMSFITALLLAYEPAKRLARMRVSLEAGMVGVRMMFELLDHEIDISEMPDAKPLVRGNGSIEFKNVTFFYNGDVAAIRNVNLEFPAGKMTALVGPSGSGKSTMINLVMRMYDPREGAVFIDGMNLKEVTFESLRQRIAYVGQDTFLFDESIMENIRFGRMGASDEDVMEAAKMANAHDFIVEKPNGYATGAGENGGNLSGGQKQRIAIARAMLRNADVLILDEATSALDSQSESLVQEALERLTKGRTTIVIAHRLSTVARADKIVVLSGGEVVEFGTQADLLARNGLYRRIHDTQFAHLKLDKSA